MEAKFNANFNEFYSNKRQQIITTDKYDQIVATLQKFIDPDNSSLQKTKEEYQFCTRFSIRTENSAVVLYHNGPKNDHSRVVKKEDLYGILKQTHDQLGHGGRDCMWQKLRSYHGISK